MSFAYNVLIRIQKPATIDSKNLFLVNRCRNGLSDASMGCLCVNPPVQMMQVVREVE